MSKSNKNKTVVQKLNDWGRRAVSESGERKSGEEKAKALKDYEAKFSNPYRAAELGYVDEIILPQQTRQKLIQALNMTQTKNRVNPAKKHGNIPL